MPTYQLRFLGSDNQRVATQVIEAEDDFEAFDKASNLANGHAVEVWDGRRFIATAEAIDILKSQTEGGSAAPP